MAQRTCIFWLAVLVAVTVAVADHLPASAQAKRSAGAQAGKAMPKPGQIDVEKSRVFVRVGKKGLGHEHGVEGKIKSGTIRLEGEKDFGQIEFDMTSFLADTEEARKAVDLNGSIGESTRGKVTETMLGPAVLDVEEHPTATFKIKSCRGVPTRVGGPWYAMKGDFTLHGTTRPLEVMVEQSRENGRFRLRGDFTILQSDFGITPYKAALGTVGVADELKIWGDIWVGAEERAKK